MVVMDEKRMKAIIILQETARVMSKLNPDVAAMLLFLESTVQGKDEKDLAQWLSFYARMSFDKKYGDGASAEAERRLMEGNPKNMKELSELMRDFFDNH